jgi:hypothetical protein
VTFLISYLPVILAAGAAIVLFVYRNWRWNILAISLQYVAVFWLVLTVWPAGLAAVKLVSGWMAVAVIGSSIPEVDQEFNRDSPGLPEIRFRVILGFILWLIVFAIAPAAQTSLPVATPLLLGGILLASFGLLTVAMDSEPIRIIFGLLSIFSGFEVVYAALESSVMVAGFLSMVTLGIALVGAYLLNQSLEIKKT